jgi:hypothetical protein
MRPFTGDETFYRHSVAQQHHDLFQQFPKSPRSQRIVRRAPLPSVRDCGSLPLERDDQALPARVEDGEPHTGCIKRDRTSLPPRSGGHAREFRAAVCAYLAVCGYLNEKKTNEITLGENDEENRVASSVVCLPADSPRGMGFVGEFHLHRHRHCHRQSILRTCLDGTRCVRRAEQQVRHHGQ